MADQFKNMLIGLFVVAAFAIIVFVLMFLHPGIGNEGKVLRVRFANIDKVTVGTRVSLAGKPVGEVIEINEIPGANTERVGRDGYIYYYELLLAVDTSVNVYNTDTIDVRTSGLLGERSISINPGVPKPGEKLVIVNNDIIYATETASIEQTLKEFKELADSFEATFDQIAITVKEINRVKLWEKVANTVDTIHDIAKALDQPDMLTGIISNLFDVSESVKKSWPKVDTSLKNIQEISERTNVLVTNTSKGEGTIGKLFVKDDIYLKISSLLSKAEITLNDVNHYGILFHLDKGWQRMRARRLNLLNKLATPQEFRNFFNDEIDQITTSLERVSLLLENQEDIPPYCYDFLLNGEYTKVYSELLRRVKDLEEGLQMYNQQAMDAEVKKTELQDICYE